MYNKLGDCMNLIICDDNPQICKEIEMYINKNFDFTTYICHTESELFDIVAEKKGDIQAVILDIVLGENSNGIDAGAKLHNLHPAVKIIFLTGYEDIYYKDVFSKFQPFGFITKPIPYNILNFFLRKIHNNEKAKRKCIRFVSDYKEISLPVADIIFIQSRKRIIEISTQKNIYKTYMKISNIEKELNENFIRCHQSYIVNTSMIKNVYKNHLVLKNEDLIPISRKYSQTSQFIKNAFEKGK